MSETETYHWPTKLKKFGIVDPFQKILATKYEKEIPWQVKVRDPGTLDQFIKDDLLPKLLAKLELPDANATINHYYICAGDINLDDFINAAINRDNPDVQAIKMIREKQGDVAANLSLVSHINRTKYQGFLTWVDFLDIHYGGNYAFKYLLLKPLFDQGGKGVRRVIGEPSFSAAEWLHRRISIGRLLPDEQIAKQYYLKLGLGNESNSDSGWQYIPAGYGNAAQLSAACAGSGWCVAGMNYATQYLGGSDFYILRLNRMPVVALRVTHHGQIIEECQGRFNRFPTGFANEILLFINCQGFQDEFHRGKEIKAQQCNLAAQPKEWWQKQITLWPFAIASAPALIKEELMPMAQSAGCRYLHFKHFDRLSAAIGLQMDEKAWEVVVEENPHRYASAQPSTQHLPAIQQACKIGWLNRVASDQLTAHEIPSIPKFVLSDSEFQAILDKHIPSAIRQAIRKHPTNYDERVDRIKLEKILPAPQDESADWVLERMVNVLLANEDGIYLDDKFLPVHRQRDDFSLLREQAWFEAFKAHPPLWFALPPDLKAMDNFVLSQTVPEKINLEDWCAKVKEKPWILLQRSGVPKTIRWHPDILNAYRDGWLPHLRKSPWRLWLPVGMRRVYMSYALLENKQVLNAMTEGWLNQKTRFSSSWFAKPSERMRDIPAVQLAAMRAVMQIKSFTKFAVKDADTLNLCADILMRMKAYKQQNLPELRLYGEIKILLANRGVR